MNIVNIILIKIIKNRIQLASLLMPFTKNLNQEILEIRFQTVKIFVKYLYIIHQIKKYFYDFDH